MRLTKVYHRFSLSSLSPSLFPHFPNIPLSLSLAKTSRSPVAFRAYSRRTAFDYLQPALMSSSSRFHRLVPVKALAAENGGLNASVSSCSGETPASAENDGGNLWLRLRVFFFFLKFLFTCFICCTELVKINFQLVRLCCLTLALSG